MPRHSRFQTGGHFFHVLNRRAGRQRLFSCEGDYFAFLSVLDEARCRTTMRILAYALTPTHWHLLLWPESDADLADCMQWLTLTHTQRWHVAHDSIGTGPLYQGRYKSFPVQEDDHFYTVARYIERNPLRARLVREAQNWRWSSLWQREQDTCPVQLSAWPLPVPQNWVDRVNGAETEAELAALRKCSVTGIPFGNSEWRLETAKRLGLPMVARERGRPSNPF